MKAFRLAILIALFVAVAGTADIVPIPGSQKVNPVFDAADAVYYLHILGTTTKSIAKEQRGEATVDVLQRQAIGQVIDVYKGLKQAEVMVDYVDETPATRGDLPSVNAGDYVLAFLSKGTTGRYLFAETHIGAVRISSIAPAPQTTPGLAKLQQALLSLIPGPASAWTKVQAMQLLLGIEPADPNASQALSKLTTASDTELAATAMALWLKSDRAAAIQVLPVFLEARASALDGIQILNITNQIGTVSGHAAISSLERIADSADPNLRFAAAYALRQSGSTENIPKFVGLLDDPDRNVAYQAVIALSELTGKGGDYGPNMQVFLDDPQRYISLWKAWYSSVGKPA